MWVRAFAVLPPDLNDDKPGKERHIQKTGFGGPGLAANVSWSGAGGVEEMLTRLRMWVIPRLLSCAWSAAAWTEPRKMPGRTSDIGFTSPGEKNEGTSKGWLFREPDRSALCFCRVTAPCSFVGHWHLGAVCRRICECRSAPAFRDFQAGWAGMLPA